jgi:hypothetical protein
MKKPPFQITNDKQNIYDDYAMKPGSPKPFFVRVSELRGQLDIDGRKVEKTLDYIRPPWYTDDGKRMDWSLCKIKKGTPNEIFRAEFQELVKKIQRKIQRPH